jgi:hypothetical protein
VIPQNRRWVLLHRDNLPPRSVSSVVADRSSGGGFAAAVPTFRGASVRQRSTDVMSALAWIG